MKSERQLAKELGMSRISLWRCKQLAEVPEDLLEEYLAECRREQKKPSIRVIVNQWRAQLGQNELRGGSQRCPNCGHRFGGSRAGQSKITTDVEQACERAVLETIYSMRHQMERGFMEVGRVTAAKLDPDDTAPLLMKVAAEERFQQVAVLLLDRLVNRKKHRRNNAGKTEKLD